MTDAADRAERVDVAVIGAGLAGLACARALHAAGRDVVVLEASDGIGGRVRTDDVEGFQLDRGFQVLFTAYPEVERQLDLDALSLGRFERGAVVRVGGRFHRLADPFRGAGARALGTGALDAIRAPIGSLPDKIRMARLRRELLGKPAADLLRGPDQSTASALRERGFSDSMIDRFFRPLFGGIQLDQSLTTSSRMFDVMFRTLASSDAALPAKGMMRTVRRPSDDLAFDERRGDERDVVEVRAARERIVDDDLVARGEPLPSREEFEDRTHRCRHRAEVHGDVLGLHELLASGVEERRGAVGPLLDVRAERRPAQHGAHLVCDALEPPDQHRQPGRIERHQLRPLRSKPRPRVRCAGSAARRSSALSS